MLPATVPVTITEHVALTFVLASVQVWEENVTLPVPANLDQVIVPVRVGLVPVTVAVHVIFAPTAMLVLVQVMVVVVVAFVTVSVVVPKLPLLAGFPW